MKEQKCEVEREHVKQKVELCREKECVKQRIELCRSEHKKSSTIY